MSIIFYLLLSSELNYDYIHFISFVWWWISFMLFHHLDFYTHKFNMITLPHIRISKDVQMLQLLHSHCLSEKICPITSDLQICSVSFAPCPQQACRNVSSLPSRKFPLSDAYVGSLASSISGLLPFY